MHACLGSFHSLTLTPLPNKVLMKGTKRFGSSPLTKELLSYLYSRALSFIFRALFFHFMFSFCNAFPQSPVLSLKIFPSRSLLLVKPVCLHSDTLLLLKCPELWFETFCSTPWLLLCTHKTSLLKFLLPLLDFCKIDPQSYEC